eukprot:1675365-Alexandrium_andersonii.AAC.1
MNCCARQARATIAAHPATSSRSPRQAQDRPPKPPPDPADGEVQNRRVGKQELQKLPNRLVRQQRQDRHAGEQEEVLCVADA